MTSIVFSIQDDSGTVSQLTLAPSPVMTVEVGDTGSYAGIAFNGTLVGSTVDIPFTVTQVLDAQNFSVSSFNANLADWPPVGTITWLTGFNAPGTATIEEINGANAYVSTDYFLKYITSRGYSTPGWSNTTMQNAIVQATDYIDQKYRFKGVKLVQTIGSSNVDPNLGFIQPWLSPFNFGQNPFLTPATTTQTTEWPRQGVVDINGDTINGMPEAVKRACVELAYRQCSGIALQPDYDSNVVRQGAVVSSLTEDVGPIRTTVTYDTKLGVGFFAPFPQVDRILARAGLLVAGGRRSVLR